MPNVGAIIISKLFIGPWMTTAIGLTVFKIAAAAINLSLLMGLSYVSAKMFAPKFGDSVNGRTEMTRGASMPKRFIFGKCKVSGNVTYAHTTALEEANDNGYLHFILCLAGHEVESIEDIKFNDKPLALATTTTDDNDVPIYLPASGNAYEGKVRVKKYFGTDTQPADAELIANTSATFNGKWTTDHQGKGVAYLYIRLEWDAEVFPQGWPAVTAVVEGWKRTGEQIYTRNPITLCKEYLIYDSERGGGGYPLSSIDSTVLAASEGICDELVEPYDGATNQKRYFCDFTALTSDEMGEIIQRFLDSCAGWIDWDGGKWLLKAGAYSSAAITIEDTDVVGPVQCTARESIRAASNGIKGLYLSPDDDYNPAEFPRFTASAKNQTGAHKINTTANTLTQQGKGVINGDRVRVLNFPSGTMPGGAVVNFYYYVVGATSTVFQLSQTEGGAAVNLTSRGTNVFTQFDPFLTEDGRRIWADLEFETISDNYLAQRLAKIQLLRIRNDFRLVMEVRMKAFALTVGDSFRIKNNKLGQLGLTGDPVETTTTGATNLFTKVAHGLANDDTIAPTAITGDAGELLVGQYYYVISVTADTFQLARRRAGEPVPVGDGTMTYRISEGNLFECIETTLVTRNESNDGKGYVYVRLIAQETQEDLFDWDAGFVSESTFGADTDLPNPRDVAAPTGLTQESGTNQLFANSDGTITSRMKLSWTGVPDQFVQSGGYYEIQYKLTADADTAFEDASPPTATGNASFVHVLGLQDGENYDLRIRAVNTIGSRSSYARINNQEMIGKTAPPAPVTLADYTERRGSVLIEWTDPTALDLSHISVRTVMTNNYLGTEIVGPLVHTEIAKVLKGKEQYVFTQDSIPVFSSLNPFFRYMGGYSFELVAVDTTGNESTVVLLEKTDTGGIKIVQPDNHGTIRADSPEYEITSIDFPEASTLTTTPANLFREREPVIISSTGTMPGGLTADTVYFVRSTSVLGNIFRVSATLDGAEIEITSAGTGTITVNSLRIGLFFDITDDQYYSSSSAIIALDGVTGDPRKIPLSGYTDRNTQDPLILANQIIFARGMVDGSDRFIWIEVADKFGATKIDKITINYVERTPLQG